LAIQPNPIAVFIDHNDVSYRATALSLNDQFVEFSVNLSIWGIYHQKITNIYYLLLFQFCQDVTLTA
jgi:hypothetical protein